MLDDILIPLGVMAILFIGLPWIIFHYVTRWKTAATLTNDDEKMLSEMYETARRLEERLDTIERIVKADNPDYRPGRIGRETARDPKVEAENIRTLERRG